MKLFALRDGTDPDDFILAVLCYYEYADEYYIDMPQGVDPWTVPFVLSSFASRGCWSIDARWSKRWVESRLVPRSRQNIGEVLRVNGLEGYETVRLLEMTEGRNSQDDCYLQPVTLSQCPSWYQERERHRVVEVVALGGMRLLVAFRTGEARYYSADDIRALDSSTARILADEDAFCRVETAPGGRGIRWGHAIGIGDDKLAAAGAPLPLSWDDLMRIAPALLVDAAEAAEALGCTRQNLHALAKRGSLAIAKTSGKATLFYKADVQARMAGADAHANVPGLRGATRYATVKLPKCGAGE